MEFHRGIAVGTLYMGIKMRWIEMMWSQVEQIEMVEHKNAHDWVLACRNREVREARGRDRSRKT